MTFSMVKGAFHPAVFAGSSKESIGQKMLWARVNRSADMESSLNYAHP
jgi:hypothetical protein